MKVVVCGSRDFPNPLTASLAIDQRMAALPPGSIVIHGAAVGADMTAAESAFRHGHDVRAFPAQWKTEGNRAGILRNIRMLNECPELVIAFWDGESKGTKHTITEAKKRGVPVEIIDLTAATASAAGVQESPAP